MNMDIKIGTTFNCIYADANPLWTVKKKRGEDTYECMVENDPDWRGTRKVFGGEDIRQLISTNQGWERWRAERADWFSTLRVGSTYHYHNAFGEFVRCRVVLGKDEYGNVKNLFQPIALVGTWKPHDLPRRQRDGQIYYPYHADKIVNKIGAWQPDPSTIFEHPSFSGRGRFGDPREMQPISLNLPSMEGDEAEKARLERVRITAMEVLKQCDEVDFRDGDMKAKMICVFEEAIAVLKQGMNP